MAQTHKLLGKTAANGAIGTYTTLYTVPDFTQCILSRIVAVNKNASAQTIRVAIGAPSTTPVAGDWDVYDFTIDAKDSLTIGQGATPDTTNKYVLVSASSSDVNFKAYGVELT